MQLQKFKKKRKYELYGFQFTVKSLPNIPVFYGLNSHRVDCTSHGSIKFKTPPITEDAVVTSKYREKGCVERTLPAPTVSIGEYINGVYDFIIIKTRDKVVIQSRRAIMLQA